MIKRNRTHRQYSARSAKWLDILAHSDISKKHTTGKILVLTDYRSRHPTEEATNEEIHDEEYLVEILSELFQLNHKYGQLINTNRKSRPTDQSTNMTLTAHRESTNEIVSQKKIKSDVYRKNFMREQAPAINSINTEFILRDKNKNFYFTDSKIEKHFKYDYHHWGAN